MKTIILISLLFVSVAASAETEQQIVNKLNTEHTAWVRTEIKIKGE